MACSNGRVNMQSRHDKSRLILAPEEAKIPNMDNAPKPDDLIEVSQHPIRIFGYGDRVCFDQDPKWQGTVIYVGPHGRLVDVLWDQTMETTMRRTQMVYFSYQLRGL